MSVKLKIAFTVIEIIVSAAGVVVTALKKTKLTDEDKADIIKGLYEYHAKEKEEFNELKYLGQQ